MQAITFYTVARKFLFSTYYPTKHDQVPWFCSHPQYNQEQRQQVGSVSTVSQKGQNQRLNAFTEGGKRREQVVAAILEGSRKKFPLLKGAS